MPNIFELCSDQKDFNKLQKIKNNFLKAKEEHIKYYNNKYLELANTKWRLYKYNKLSYVNILSHKILDLTEFMIVSI